jgi:hypothetical protein
MEGAIEMCNDLHMSNKCRQAKCHYTECCGGVDRAKDFEDILQLS